MIGPGLSPERPPRRVGQGLLRIGGVLLGLTVLGACQTSAARRTAPRFETAFSALPATGNRPLVSLPNSGPVTSFTETQSSAGLRQRIVLGPSRSRIDLTIASGRVWDDPAMERPCRAGIAAELASLDGGAYHVLRRPAHNANGPLGVAVNEHCAYAWQWIDGLDRVELERGALRGPLAASIRVQHCRRQPTTAESLLADLARMRLGPVHDAGIIAGGTRQRRASPKPASEPVEVATAVVPAPRADESCRRRERQPYSRDAPAGTDGPSISGPTVICLGRAGDPASCECRRLGGPTTLLDRRTSPVESDGGGAAPASLAPPSSPRTSNGPRQPQGW